MKSGIVIVVLMIIKVGVYGQQKLSVPALYPLQSSVKKAGTFKADTVKPVLISYLGATTPPSPAIDPGTYYQQCFGFFCKKEWYFEQKVKVPVKLRLGSYQEAQRLEGK